MERGTFLVLILAILFEIGYHHHVMFLCSTEVDVSSEDMTGRNLLLSVASSGSVAATRI
jgi:hypothetical protein